MRLALGVTLAAASFAVAPLSCTGRPAGARAVEARAVEIDASGAATIEGITIPTRRPRLLYDPELLTRARAWYAKDGFRPKGSRWMHVAFAALVTGDSSDRASWCKAAVANAIQQTLAMPTEGTACDICRWHGEDVIVAYDWCHEFFTPEQRTAFVERTNVWVEKWRSVHWGGAHMTQNNYYWGNLRNQLAWGIASFHENREAAEVFIRDALQTRWAESFVPAAKTYNKGGIFHEGSAYGRYPPHYAVIPFRTARLMGRDLFAETDFWKAAVVSLVYQTTPSPTHNALHRNSAYEIFPFNDDSFWKDGGSAGSRLYPESPGSFYGDFLQTVADAWPSSPYGQWAQEWVNRVKPSLSPWVRAAAGKTAPRSFASLPLDYHAEGIGFFYVRSRWDEASAVLQLQLGLPTGVGHQHSDHGSFQLWRGGRWLSRETADYGAKFTGFGGTGIVGAHESAPHNTLLVNPDSQGCNPGTTCLGQGGAPIWGDVNGPPVVRRLESRPTHFYVAVDLTDSYRNHEVQKGTHKERDNPAAKHVEREFVWVRALETLVVLDRVRSNDVGGVPAERIKKTFLAHCEVPWTLDDGRRATCTNGPQALRVTTLVPAAAQRGTVAEGSGTGQHRLEVSTSGAAESYLLHVLQAAPAGAPALAPTVKETDDGWTVTLNGEYALTFEKGKSASGGGIAVGGKVQPFGSGVQRMVITEAGPAWTEP